MPSVNHLPLLCLPDTAASQPTQHVNPFGQTRDLPPVLLAHSLAVAFPVSCATPGCEISIDLALVGERWSLRWWGASTGLGWAAPRTG